MLMATEEQTMMREVAARIVRDAQAAGGEKRDISAPVWEALVESGWIALCLSEEDGGLGGGPIERSILAEELGRGLMLGCYLINTALPALLISAAPAGALRTTLLEQLLAGARDLAFADAEPLSRGADGAVALAARKDGKDFVLEGAKTDVWLGDDTSKLLVSAALSSGELLLAVVPLDAAGLELRAFDTIDRGRAAELKFGGVRVAAADLLFAPSAEVRLARQRAWDDTLVAVASECCGIMKWLIPVTAEYLQTRKQFGRPLAKNQALRHRMADMALASMRAEALTQQVARQLQSLSDSDGKRMASAACSKALQGARFVAEQAVQLHGGMGVSEELPIGRYLRRVMAIEATFGSTGYHRARFEEASRS